MTYVKDPGEKHFIGHNTGKRTNNKTETNNLPVNGGYNIFTLVEESKKVNESNKLFHVRIFFISKRI